DLCTVIDRQGSNPSEDDSARTVAPDVEKAVLWSLHRPWLQVIESPHGPPVFPGSSAGLGPPLKEDPELAPALPFLDIQALHEGQSLLRRSPQIRLAGGLVETEEGIADSGRSIGEACKRWFAGRQSPGARQILEGDPGVQKMPGTGQC